MPTANPVANSVIARDLVLVGGGHSHAVVLMRFAMQPEPGLRLTLICTDTDTPYSGMLPGYVAGHYGYDDVHIDLRRLAGLAGARYYLAEVTGVDRAAQTVLCRGRPPVPYDLLSINVGSTPQLAGVPGAEAYSVPVKPIRRFNQRWLDLLARVRQGLGRALRLAVVGAGAAGVEMALTLQYRLRREMQALGRDPDMLQMHLLSAEAQILPTHNGWVQRKFMRVLAERGVQLHLNAEVQRVEADRLLCANGLELAVDETLWVTQAGGAAWLKTTGLALDEQGFVQVLDTLQSTSDPLVYAAGDCAAVLNHPREKAGVFAVRQGRPLADNLRRAARGEPPQPFTPQARWLALISTGDRYAVASRGWLGFAGHWVWRWKDHIDRRFMRMYAGFAPRDAHTTMATAPAAMALPLSAEESLQAVSALAMRCGGCGAKVGASVLSRALAGLNIQPRDDVLLGLGAADDAAIVRVPAGQALVQSVDFFRAFIDDPYRFGRIAANHALGDLFAMGATPQTATAIATIPPGLERQTEQLLRALMQGAVEVLNVAGCSLIGGHSGEGQELALGFAVNGLVDENLAGVLRKSGLRPGDALILTKALGTGILLVANQSLAARGRWIDAALNSMEQSSAAAAACLRDAGAAACTDVTGFGLLGHLVEMTQASGVDVRIDLPALPLLDGALEMAAAGQFSSLQPANLRLRRAIANQAGFAGHPRYALLFDPQTAGGLLAGIPAAKAQACVAQLRALGYTQAAVIGQVLAPGQAVEAVQLCDPDWLGS